MIKVLRFTGSLFSGHQYLYSLFFNFNARKQKQINNFLRNTSFVEYKTDPTFYKNNSPGTRPDRIFYTRNISDNLSSIELIPYLGSDHLGMEFVINLGIKPKHQNTPNHFKLDHKTCNKDAINHHLIQHINHSHIDQSNNITEANNSSELLQRLKNIKQQTCVYPIF